MEDRNLPITPGEVHPGSVESEGPLAAPEQDDEEALNPNGDWSRVVVGRETYILPPTARKCFKQLYEAYRLGRTLNNETIFPPEFEGERRIDKIFSRCRPPAWAADGSRLVGPDPGLRGYYRLYLKRR